ncbi:MAG: NUDIX hydrolase [Rickettsiales bacterium]|jgi:8-oxo-dGTP pyrophosphatase MutT (NUDIX family)|nr:NUDIX hydrolase [Rickettsiales bacterium]
MPIQTIAILTDETGIVPARDEIKNRRMAARVVVFDGDGRLALFRDAGKVGLGLPGGGVESGETLTMAAVREIWEEIGARIKVTDKQIGQIIEYKKKFKQINVVFIAKLKKLYETPNELVWLPLDDAIERMEQQKRHDTLKTKFKTRRDAAVLAYVREYLRKQMMERKKVKPHSVKDSRVTKEKIK